MLYVPATLSVIVSIWLETLFYGINCTVYFLCICDLGFARKYTHKTTKSLLVSLTTILFLVATAHMGVNFSRLIKGYVDPPNKAAMLKFLVDLTEPTNVAKQFLVAFTNLFSDILIIWRIYMVWERNFKICILSVILSLSVFTAGIVSATYQSQVTLGQSIFIRRISQWGTAFISLGLAMNVSATLLIAVRIWWVTRPIRAHDPGRMHPYWRIIVIIVESAAFAAFAQTATLAFYTSDFPGVYFVADSAVQIIAMNPLLIIAFISRTQHQHQRSFTSYVPTERMLPEPIYADPGVTTTSSSCLHHHKPVHLSLLHNKGDTGSDPNTEYTSVMLSSESIRHDKRVDDAERESDYVV